MHLSTLLFASLLLFGVVSVSVKSEEERMPPPGFWVGFKHFNAIGYFESLKNAKYLERSEIICRYTYCHNQDKENCLQLCADSDAKCGRSTVHHRIAILNRTEPDANQADCEKECRNECLPSEKSTKECSKLCSIHYSFDNRKEYEAEFYKFVLEVDRRTNASGSPIFMP